MPNPVYRDMPNSRNPTSPNIYHRTPCLHHLQTPFPSGKLQLALLMLVIKPDRQSRGSPQKTDDPAPSDTTDSGLFVGGRQEYLTTTLLHAFWHSEGMLTCTSNPVHPNQGPKSTIITKLHCSCSNVKLKRSGPGVTNKDMLCLNMTYGVGGVARPIRRRKRWQGLFSLLS